MSDASSTKGNQVIVRTVVGAIYFVVMVSCLYAGIVVTSIAISIMACLCAWELLQLIKGSGRQPNEIIALVATALFPLMPLLRPQDGMVLVLMALLIACSAWFVLVPRVFITDVGMTIFVPIYCGSCFTAVTLIRSCDPGMQGFLLTFAAMGSIWLNDAMAYFVGSRFGKRKLSPRISPNKSIEGFWGGMIACVFIWMILAILKVRGISFLFAIPCGLMVGAMGVVGDLFESRIKRGFGVKDSGNLLPGHGGMLDRSDALLFGVMTAFLLLRFGGYV